MRPRLLLIINCKFAVDFFARGLHTRIAVARLPLRQLGFLVLHVTAVMVRAAVQRARQERRDSAECIIQRRFAIRVDSVPTTQL